MIRRLKTKMLQHIRIAYTRNLINYIDKRVIKDDAEMTKIEQEHIRMATAMINSIGLNPINKKQLLELGSFLGKIKEICLRKQPRSKIIIHHTKNVN